LPKRRLSISPLFDNRVWPEVLSVEEAGIPQRQQKKTRALDRIGLHQGYG